MNQTHLVAQSLGCNDGDLIADTLVGLEVEGELWVVALNDDLGGLLDGLGTNATHVCGCAGLIDGRVVNGRGWSSRSVVLRGFTRERFPPGLWSVACRLNHGLEVLASRLRSHVQRYAAVMQYLVIFTNNPSGSGACEQVRFD